MRSLYICYLSLREPLVQSQVLPYLRQLVSAGVEVQLLTFEKQLKEISSDRLAADKTKLSEEGITWFYLPYHKYPSVPATAYDVLSGAIAAIRLVRRHRIRVLHARAHIAMAMALIAKRVTGCAAIFDLRGLVAEEYADAGIWKENSFAFRAMKRLERAGLRRANQIVVLSERARDWLIKTGRATAEKISVIPCCVDLSRFDSSNEITADASQFELVYAGSVVGLYMLEEMGRFFVQLQKHQPNARFRILTLAPRDEVAAIFQRVGIKPADFEVAAASPERVPDQLRRGRLGISFRKPTFSQIAASPTKIGEYLAAGIPIVSNAGTGDIDEILKRDNVGVTISSFDDQSLEKAAVQALALAHDPEIEMRCHEAARHYFDLVSVGRKRYQDVYQRIEREALNPVDSKITA